MGLEIIQIIILYIVTHSMTTKIFGHFFAKMMSRYNIKIRSIHPNHTVPQSVLLIGDTKTLNPPHRPAKPSSVPQWRLVLLGACRPSVVVVLRSSWKAFWKPAACCVAPSDALMLEMKVLIFLLVSLVAGDSRLL